MADHAKSSGDGAKAPTQILNGPTSKESSPKYPAPDSAQPKEPVAAPIHSIQKPASSNATSGKSKETRFEIVNVSSYSYTEDPSVDELEDASNTEELTSENREASQEDEAEEGVASPDGLNSVEDAANGSPLPAQTTRDSGSSSLPQNLLSQQPLTSTPTNPQAAKSNPSSTLLNANGAEADSASSTGSDHAANFPANNSGSVTITGSRLEGGDSFAKTHGDQFNPSPTLTSNALNKSGIIASGVVTPTGEAVVTSCTTTHGYWTTSGADFVQHSNSSMETSVSRFRVVKIHSDKKIRRGRWQCQDYYDASSEKTAASKDPEVKSSLAEGGSGNSSAASSVHYVHGENPASENPLVKLMSENPPDEFIPTILTTLDSQKFLVIPQPSEAKGAYGLQTPGNVFAGDHPLLQHTQHNFRALTQNASQPSLTPAPSVGHHPPPSSPYGKTEVSSLKSSPESQIREADGSSKTVETLVKPLPESHRSVPLVGTSQSATPRTTPPHAQPHPNSNSNSCSYASGKEIDDASHSASNVEAERGRGETPGYEGSPIRVKTVSEPPSDVTGGGGGVHVLPLVQTPTPKEEVRNSNRLPNSSIPSSNESVKKAIIPDARTGSAVPASDHGLHHQTDNSASLATLQQQQQNSALSSSNQNSHPPQGREYPRDANLGLPHSGGSSPAAASASKESSPQSHYALIAAAPATTTTTTTTTTVAASVHTNVSSPPSVTSSAQVSSSMPAASTSTNQTQSATSGQFPNAQNQFPPSAPTKQHPHSLSMQPSASSRPSGGNTPSAPSLPVAQNLVNSATPPQVASSTAVPSPTLVGGAGVIAQSPSTNQLPNVTDGQSPQPQSPLTSRGQQQQQQQQQPQHSLPSASTDTEVSRLKGTAAPSTTRTSSTKPSSETTPDLSTTGTQQQHHKAPSNNTTHGTPYENGKPQPSQADQSHERDSSKKPTIASPPKSASSQSTMTKEPVVEKPPSTPTASRFKVTEVPESEVPSSSAAAAFKPLAAPPSQAPDVAKTASTDDAGGLTPRPTTIPIESGHASRRGSINEAPVTADSVVRSAGSAALMGVDRLADIILSEADQDIANPIHDLKEELQGGVSPASRQSSKRDVDVESEGSGTEEGGVASTVAIDNKIEQAMDLVKSHLMYAVREEVEVLKEQIKELIEKNQQLEMENAYLKSNATPDLLKQLQAHVDSSPTPPPVMAPPVASNLSSGTATSFGTGQYPTQTVTSQTGGGGTTGAASSSSSTIAAVNVTHSSSNAAPSSTTGAGAYSSSSPGNP